MHATEASLSKLSRLRKWTVTAVTVGFIYVNAAAMNNFLRHQLPSLPRLPLSPALEDLFALFGVFSHFEVVNREVAIDALCEITVNGVNVASWIEIDPDEYFPFPRGEQLSRLAVARTWPGLSCNSPEAARHQLCAKLKARHELQHPGQRLRRVRISQITWPRSARGYEAERARAGACSVVWYEG